MKSTRDLISAIRKVCPAKADPDDWLARQLDRIKGIRREIADLEHDRIDILDSFKKQLAAADREIAAARNKCPHYLKTYHGDPAGGSDSYTECDICGKDLGK